MKQKEEVSQTQQIRKQIQTMEKGTIFFSDAFAYENKAVLRVVLARLVHEGLIERLGPGIYLPKVPQVLGKNVTPSIEEIAQAVAKQEKSRLAPSGSYALYKLGLSTQVPTVAVFLTDGSPRKLVLKDGRTVVFKRTTARNLAFTSKRMQLLVASLKEIGAANPAADQMAKIRKIIDGIPEHEYKADRNLAPEWMQKLFMQIREKKPVGM
jgi:hypothetical protein